MSICTQVRAGSPAAIAGEDLRHLHVQGPECCIQDDAQHELLSAARLSQTPALRSMNDDSGCLTEMQRQLLLPPLCLFVQNPAIRNARQVKRYLQHTSFVPLELNNAHRLRHLPHYHLMQQAR